MINLNQIVLMKVMPQKSINNITNNTSGLTLDMYKYRCICLNTTIVPVPLCKVLLSPRNMT